MQVEHLGRLVDLDPQQAAVENRIVRMLRKHRTGVRQPKLFAIIGAARQGEDVFKAAVGRLADEERLIKRVTSTQENSFVLQLTIDGERQADILENLILQNRKDSVTA